MDELFQTAEQLPDVNRHEVYAHHEDTDEGTKIPYRDSLWTDDGRATGVVSSNDEFYNIIQYGNILETVGDAVGQHRDDLDLTVEGSVTLSPTAHKMTADIDFHGDTTVYAAENDPIDVGLKVRSGHSGLHGLKYDIGAERQVCSNGMMAFVSDLHFEQTHNDPFQPGLDDYRLEHLDTLRFGIKKDRDKHFVETRYDDLDIDGAPKSFWLNSYEQDVEQEELDEYSQSALDEFR